MSLFAEKQTYHTDVKRQQALATIKKKIKRNNQQQNSYAFYHISGLILSWIKR